MLNHSSNDVASFLTKQMKLAYQKSQGTKHAKYLIECFIVPMRIDFAQLVCNAIVFAHENRVQSHEHHLLINAWITSDEAVNIAARTEASTIRIVELRRQEILQTQTSVHGVGLELTVAESAQFTRCFFIRSIHKVGINKARHRIESTSGSCDEKQKQRTSSLLLLTRVLWPPEPHRSATPLRQHLRPNWNQSKVLNRKWKGNDLVCRIRLVPWLSARIPDSGGGREKRTDRRLGCRWASKPGGADRVPRHSTWARHLF